MNAILISGSRNPKGQTARALDAVAGVAQDKLAEALRQSISQIAKG